MDFEFSKIDEVDQIYQEAQEYCKQDDIDTRINKYHQILEEIRELKMEIERGNFISINDLEDLEEEINKRNEELRLHKETIELPRRSSPCLSNTIYPLSYKIRNHNISYLNANYQSDSIKLKALQIIKYNLEKKKRLKEIYQEYHSEEDIINNLQNIYLHQIKSLISSN